MVQTVRFLALTVWENRKEGRRSYCIPGFDHNSCPMSPSRLRLVQLLDGRLKFDFMSMITFWLGEVRTRMR